MKINYESWWYSLVEKGLNKEKLKMCLTMDRIEDMVERVKK